MRDVRLNGQPLAAFGFIPGRHADTNLAIRGAWDMPPRIGKTYHDWGGMKGVEPYVSADEIRFGGRDIDFTMFVQAPNANEALRRCYSLFDGIDLYTDLVPFQNDMLGTWNVYVRNRIQAEYIRNGVCSVLIPFREPIVDLSGDLPTNIPNYSPVGLDIGLLADSLGALINIGQINYDGYGIDGVMFKDMGLIILDMKRHLDRPQPKSREAIAYSHEPYRIDPTGIREITINALIRQPDYASFMAVIRGLYALFSKPGLRCMTKKDDALRDFFVKDGFTVSGVRVFSNIVYGLIELRISEVAAYTDWNTLTDTNGNSIQTEFGNIIIT